MYVCMEYNYNTFISFFNLSGLVGFMGMKNKDSNLYIVWCGVVGELVYMRGDMEERLANMEGGDCWEAASPSFLVWRYWSQD